MMYWGNGMNGLGMLLMTFSTLVFWGVVIAGVVYLVRQTANRPQPNGALQPDPQQILAARYARGEIDDEEYRRRSTALRGGPPAGFAG